jgi:Carboxypeptidase regulatory-like domain
VLLAAFSRRACLVVVLSVIPASVLAQGASTATIGGVVRDSSGAVLPGVTIEAASPALIEKVRSTISDERGEYRLPELRPGTYTVTFTLPGFATLKRDGLELRTNFTARVDAEMTVSQIEETITVSGAAPLVDATSATQQRTVSRELLDTVPTAKSVLGIAALIPAVVEPPNAQDVGGSKGERSVRITVHGGKTFDSRLLQDGMRYNALTPGLGSLEGTGRGYYVNPLAVQEVVVDLGTMGSAAYSLGGAQVNSIPRDGGNRFTGSFFVAGTGDDLQSNNLDDDLIAQGLTSVNSVKKVYDFNAAFGGPVLTDRLWFFASARRWGTTTGVANLFADTSVTDFAFTPDSGRPIEPEESNKGIGARLTYQATSKDKLTFSWDKQRNFQDQLTGQLETGTIKNEGNAGYCQRHEVMQGSWSRPHSNALLFDAGVTVSKFNFGGFGEDLFLSDYEGCGGGIQDNVSINDTGLGFTYNGVGNRTMSLSHQSNGRFNVSLITGRHSIKTGVFWMYGLGGGHRTYTTRAPTQVNGLPVSYTFFNGVPRSLTQFASPGYTVDQLNPDLGLFVQDQWRISRVTISAGLRFDWLRESVKATEVPAGMLVPARSFPARTDVPNWKDLNPRFAIVWDPTGSGKTAIKFGINRYVQSATTGHAQLFDQAAGAVNSTTRSWNDQFFAVGDPRRDNFLPDCNLVSTTANGECGAMANPNFGTYVPVNSPDPDWITGWGKRTYNWQTSINVDREVIPNVVVNAGYFRTWYGNFQVTDNLRVTPADYSPYCVAVPVDDRLALSGQQLCGLYDINPGAFGQVDNLITRNDAYGKQEEIYNGVDVNFQVRLLGRATLGGGWNIGNSVQLGTFAGGSASSGTDTCYVIDSPQQLFNCKVDVPYQNRVKLNGSFTFPYGIQVAAVFQSNPGANYGANRTYTLAEIQPSLGRPLSGGVTAVVIPLAVPLSVFGPRINQFDLRGTKILPMGAARLQLNVDAYNLFNSNTPVTLFGTYNARWGQPTQVLDGRLVKFSVGYDF